MLRSSLRNLQSKFLHSTKVDFNQKIFLNSFSETKLIDYGCQVIKNFISKEQASFLNELTSSVHNIHKINNKLLDIDQASLGKSFFDKRSRIFYSSSNQRYLGVDYGMIDIFNPVQKHLFEKIIYDKYISIQNKILEQLYSCLRKLDLSLRWTNLYLYKDVCWPRPLHIDTNNIQIKVFLPCMDILDLRQGPYSYVPYSHKWQYVHRLNQKYNKIFNSDLGADNYDSTFFSSSMALPLFADKRSIIITMQNGIHGDLVAETGYGKNLFVWAFHPSGLF